MPKTIMERRDQIVEVADAMGKQLLVLLTGRVYSNNDGTQLAAVLGLIARLADAYTSVLAEARGLDEIINRPGMLWMFDKDR